MFKCLAEYRDFLFQELSIAPLPALPLHLQKKGSGVEAESTTEEEFLDNLWWICSRYKSKTGQLPILIFDNNKIQQTGDVSTLHSEHGSDIHLDPTVHKPKFPTYSPDLNRPIEHLFGRVKAATRNHLYTRGAEVDTGIKLQRLVHKIIKGMQHDAVKHDVQGLPVLWQVLSTPAGVQFADDRDRLHIGTGGDWPLSIYR